MHVKKSPVVKLGFPLDVYKHRDNDFVVDSKVLSFILEDTNVSVNKRFYNVINCSFTLISHNKCQRNIQLNVCNV